MQKRGYVALSALALAVASASCGSDSDSSRSAFINEFCDLFRTCCAEAGLRADGEQCRLFYGAIASTSYNEAAGEACLAELRVAATQPGFCTGEATESETCTQVFPTTGGNKAPGATCSTSDECAPSAQGDVDCASAFVNGATIQKCQVQAPGQEGSTPCVGTKEENVISFTGNDTDVVPLGYICDVAQGLYCADTGACARLKAVGEACSGGFFSDDCVRTAYCDFTQQMCLAKKAAGTACSGSGAEECVTGTFCNNAGVCAAQVAIGGACEESDECESDNCTNGACEAGFEDLGLILICGTP